MQNAIEQYLATVKYATASAITKHLNANGFHTNKSEVNHILYKELEAEERVKRLDRGGIRPCWQLADDNKRLPNSEPTEFEMETDDESSQLKELQQAVVRLKEKNASLEKQVNEVYSQRAKFFQLAMALAKEADYPVGVRVVGHQDKGYKQCVIRLGKNNDNTFDVSTHIKDGDIFFDPNNVNQIHELWKHENTIDFLKLTFSGDELNAQLDKLYAMVRNEEDQFVTKFVKAGLEKNE